MQLQVQGENKLEKVTYRSPEGEEVVLSVTSGGDLQVTATPQLAGDHSPLLSFEFSVVEMDRNTVFCQDPEAYDLSVAQYYQESLFGRALEAPALFDAHRVTTVIEPERVRAYHAVTGGLESNEVPLNMAFSLAWEPIFTVMSTPDLSRGLLRLVHLSNRFETHSGWPLTAGETVEVSARVSHVENRNQGRTIQTVATLHRDGEPCLTLESAFFVRDAFGNEPVMLTSSH